MASEESLSFSRRSRHNGGADGTEREVVNPVGGRTTSSRVCDFFSSHRQRGRNRPAGVASPRRLRPARRTRRRATAAVRAHHPHAGESATSLQTLGARGEIRTLTSREGPRGLSPLRLPVTPPGQATIVAQSRARPASQFNPGAMTSMWALAARAKRSSVVSRGHVSRSARATCTPSGMAIDSRSSHARSIRS